MATNRSRIPGAIGLFNSYIASTADYFEAGTPESNAARLGILDTEKTAWLAFRDEWNPLYPLYENKRSTRTMLVTDQLHAIIKDTKTYDKEHHLLDRIAASPNVTITDLSTFNIKSGPLAKQRRTKPSKPIDALVIPDLVQIGGGELSITCRNNMDARTGIIDEANGVELLYLVGTEPPASANDPLLRQSFSSRARFTLNLGNDSNGKTAYLYFRWVNSKYPTLAGPWTRMYSVLVV
ncbi:hypothetical protein [Mangrovibacterium diazotrophicum]|uniref:Uncharacterized protein n=1 Tax=Mangrovibacterium diazotrophicum TaxID=1261403 RepID=A0A419VUE0_9BACT|nr:hypothetical protein [Mangrovibacterium diazotrophicum]RKD85095.1 hypothetical protein BC643_4614 [Mangrovibacterium diazotrophicum]